MTMQQRPTLTPEERAVLQSHETTLAVAQSVLDDLAAGGIDTAAHQDLLDRTALARKTLLDRFTSTQYVAPAPSRARK